MSFRVEERFIINTWKSEQFLKIERGLSLLCILENIQTSLRFIGKMMGPSLVCLFEISLGSILKYSVNRISFLMKAWNYVSPGRVKNITCQMIQEFCCRGKIYKTLGSLTNFFKHETIYFFEGRRLKGCPCLVSFHNQYFGTTSFPI